jgi:hypothetical protein
MRTLVDRNHDVIIPEQIDVSCPFRDTAIVDSPGCLRERIVEIRVEEVDLLRHLGIRSFHVILQEAHIECDQVVVEELVITQSIAVFDRDFGLFLSILGIYEWLLPFISERVFFERIFAE